MVAADLKNKANNSVESIAPCGTPEVGVKYSELVESTFTHCILFFYYIICVHQYVIVLVLKYSH